MNAFVFVMLTLAAYRVWRFVGRDDITDPVRSRVIGALPKVIREWASDLLDCPWCAGTWISVGATYATHRWLIPLEPHWLLWGVAVSCAVGLIGSNLDNE